MYYIYIYMSERKFFLILSLLILGAVGKADTTPTNYELNQKIADLQREIEELKRKHANNYYVKIKGDVYDTTVNTPNDPADIGDLGVAGGLTLLQSGIAIGPRATVKNAPNEPTIGGQRDATNGIAIGVKAKVFGAKDGLAIGTGAKVDTGAQGSIAIGTGTEVSRKLDEKNSQNLARWSVAIGTKNVKSHAENGIAIGSENILAENVGSVAIGSSEVKATQETSLAIGSKDVQATRASSVAIGSSGISSTGHTSVALGSWVVSATASTSVALGSSYIAATDEYALAVGSEKVKSKKNKSVAIGAYKIESEADNAVAIGSNEVYARAEKAIAFGNDVNVNDKNAIAIGSSLTSRGLNAITIGNNSTVSKNDAIAIGSNTIASGINGITIGNNSKVLKDDNVALGSDSVANTEEKVLGYNPYEMFNKTVSETDKNKFIADKAADYNRIDAEITQLETQKTTLETELAAIEKQMETTYDTTEYTKLMRQQSLKKWFISEKENKISAKIKEKNDLYLPWMSTSGAVSVGNADKGITRQITNVSAGTLDTDAVNVAQLKNVTLNVRTTENGTPYRLKLSEKSLNLIGENGITTKIDNDGNVRIGLALKGSGDIVVKNEDNQNVPGNTNPTPNSTTKVIDLSDDVKAKISKIGAGEVTLGDTNTVTGDTVAKAINNINTSVANIGKGKVEKSNKYTVTGGEVFNAINAIGKVKVSTNSKYLTVNPIETTDKDGVKTVDYKLGFDDKKLDGIGKTSDAGIAGVAAMANLPQINNTAANRYNIAIGTGYHKGEKAIALGISGVSDGGRLVYKASLAVDSQSQKTVGLGIGYQFGKRDIEPNELDRFKAQLDLVSSQKNSLEQRLKEDRMEIEELKRQNKILNEKIDLILKKAKK